MPPHPHRSRCQRIIAPDAGITSPNSTSKHLRRPIQRQCHPRPTLRVAEERNPSPNRSLNLASARTLQAHRQISTPLTIGRVPSNISATYQTSGPTTAQSQGRQPGASIDELQDFLPPSASPPPVPPPGWKPTTSLNVTASRPAPSSAAPSARQHQLAGSTSAPNSRRHRPHRTKNRLVTAIAPSALTSRSKRRRPPPTTCPSLPPPSVPHRSRNRPAPRLNTSHPQTHSSRRRQHRWRRLEAGACCQLMGMIPSGGAEP